MKNFPAILRFEISLFLFVTIMFVTVTPASSQTAVSKVVVTDVNVNDAFPNVQVQVKPLDANSAFILGLADSQFSLREDGESLQIQEVETASLPLNVRVVFVIDEFLIAPHIQVVREAIQSFAENQMQAGDQVEVLAASESGGTQTIVELTENPEDVVNGIQEANYNPAEADGTLLLDTINKGLTDLSALSENIEGLNRMVVFSISINDLRDLKETIENAAQLRIPIHTVLLGSQDAEGALGRLALETLAGPGTISSEDLNDLFATLDAQSVQDQYLITYRSKADQSGEHNLVVTVGGVSSNVVPFTLDQLELPLVRITAPVSDTLITRTETFFGQDPETIQPTEQTVAVEINWPDGHPREIVRDSTALVVNGKSLGPATDIRDNGKDPVILEFTWDLLEENTPGETLFSVVIEAEDELGLKGISEPLPVTVVYVPFAGTDACPALISQYVPGLCRNVDLILPLVSLVVAVTALLVVAVYMRRNPKVQQRVKERLGTMMTRMGGTRVGGARTGGSPGATRMVEPLESAKAILVVLEGNSGTKQTEFRLNSTTTLGRSKDHADLVFQSDQGDRSAISRLHCTLIEKDGSFELTDQGSSNGTFLNGTRLKSGDRHRLKDGDILDLARVPDGGVKLKFKAVSPPSGHMGTRLVERPEKDSDDLPKDGYTPTKLM
jgi:hypothetical protein